ncbi:MAG: murD [Rickettsiaceae bacterium]|jgi:UDP-N-acetylmuramoylalanine--D-glutamate ligase|nr:murD [Rickettsiaceae bacterium]
MKKFLVYGLGISGNAAVKFLLEQKFEVLAGDDNKSSLDNLAKNFAGQKNLEIAEDIKKIDWTNIEYLVLAAGIPLKLPAPHPIAIEANKHNCKIVCDVEILYLFNQSAKFIGITGTNGKSTTTALTGHIFKSANKPSAVGGNIGIAALSMPRLNKDENYIIEMSSYQLDLIEKTSFHIASLLNITPDHLDRHGNMRGYTDAKKRIFLNQNKDDFAVIGIDSEFSNMAFEELKNDPNFQATLIPVSTKKIIEGGISMIGNVIHNNIKNTGSVIDLGEREFLKGEHNAQNIAVAFANCFLSGISESEIVAAVKTFKGLKHRMQFIRKIDDINFINDSKATNAESTENALKPYDNIYWILGGKAKEGGIEGLKQYFPKIKSAFLIGEATEDFAKILENEVPYFKCGDLKTAFKTAYEEAKKDKLSKQKNILLSPACASFDQWKSFEERGDFFIKLTEEL